MPLIELFDHAGHIAAPGAYEWWQFGVDDQNQRIRLDIQFHHGFTFHPEYLKRYRAYRRRPTVHPPPTPADYPCVRCAVYEDEKYLAGATVQYPRNAFKFEEAGKEIRIGANRLSLDRQLTVQLSNGELPISGELIFRPVLSCEEFQALSGEHHWLLARPLCEVAGQIRLGERKIELSGPGYHDRSFGASPLASGLSRWIRGRAMMPRGSVAFQVTAHESNGQHSATLLICDETGIQNVRDLKSTTGEEKCTAWGLAYPSSINFGERFLLRNPRIVQSSALNLNLICDAYLDGEQCQAAMEVVYPNKLTGWRAARSIRVSE